MRFHSYESKSLSKNMKTSILFLFLVVPLIAGEKVILTDKTGRVLIAEVTSMSDTTVQILKDEKPYTIQLADLDAASIKILEAYKPKPKPTGVLVHSVIIKRVKASAIGGTFRYFFDVRNYGPEEYNGKITITLHNSMPGITNGTETFATNSPIPPDTGKSVYIDSFVGPAAVHGDACTSHYSWSTGPGDTEYENKGWPVTQKYEDSVQVMENLIRGIE